MAEPDQSRRAASFTSADGAFTFTVEPVAIVLKDVALTTKHAGDDQDGAPNQVTCGVKFTATVGLAGPGSGRSWRTGWIQTIYPCGQSVTYQDPAGQKRGAMVSTQPAPMRDGDWPTSGGQRCIWYDTESSSAPIELGKPVKIGLSDQPNVPYHPKYKGQAAPWITDWNAIEVSGEKPFCSWLVAEAAEDDGELIYLYYIAWTCKYYASFADGKAVLKGGVTLVEHGFGAGKFTPCLDLDPIDENTFPFLPDEKLLAAKPAKDKSSVPFQRSTKPDGATADQRQAGARQPISLAQERGQPDKAPKKKPPGSRDPSQDGT